MNIHQASSFEHSKPQNTENIWGFSDWINHIQKQWLKSYLYKKNWKNIVCFVWKENIIEYAFDIWKQITAVNKFELWTLKTKWLWQKSNSDFLQKNIKKSKNINLLNNKINDYIINQSKQADVNFTRNPDFPDGTFMYTNQYWKGFKVVTLWGKAINITCHNNYITGHQRWAIQRAINENRLEKFEVFIPKPSTQLQVIKKTSHQVKSIINQPLEWELIPNIHDNLESIYINFETLKRLSHNSIHTSKILLPALSTLKLLITDFEISSEDLKHLLSTEELIESLFNEIAKKLQPQLENSNNKKITEIIETLKLIFIERLTVNENNSSQNTHYKNKNPEDLDIWDDIFTSGFEEKEDIQDISEQDAWNMAMQWHRNNQKAKEYRAKH